jgi:hypothetical protein
MFSAINSGSVIDPELIVSRQMVLWIHSLLCFSQMVFPTNRCSSPSFPVRPKSVKRLVAGRKSHTCLRRVVWDWGVFLFKSFSFALEVFLVTHSADNEGRCGNLKESPKTK